MEPACDCRFVLPLAAAALALAAAALRLARRPRTGTAPDEWPLPSRSPEVAVRLDENGRVELDAPDEDPPATVSFVWEHLSPEHPLGVDVVVTFHIGSQRVVYANFLFNGYPVLGEALSLLKNSVEQNIELARGWERFSTEFIRVLPETGA